MPRMKTVWARRKAGKCIGCGKVRPSAGRVRCDICLDEAATLARVRRGELPYGYKR